MFLNFLSLLNTPLTPLCGWFYEKLRLVYKTSGHTCITTSVVHGLVYLTAWAEIGNISEMAVTSNFVAVAGLSMVVIGFSTVTWIMRKYCEGMFLGCQSNLFAYVTSNRSASKSPSSTLPQKKRVYQQSVMLKKAQ